MEITAIPKNRLILVRISGEIDHHMADELRRRVERELKYSGAINIAFDFGRVTFMDSAGIGMIIGRYKTVTALGGCVIIYDASSHVRRLIEMAGIKNMVILSDTLQHGITLMKERKGARIEQ